MREDRLVFEGVLQILPYYYLIFPSLNRLTCPLGETYSVCAHTLLWRLEPHLEKADFLVSSHVPSSGWHRPTLFARWCSTHCQDYILNLNTFPWEESKPRERWHFSCSEVCNQCTSCVCFCWGIQERMLIKKQKADLLSSDSFVLLSFYLLSLWIFENKKCEMYFLQVFLICLLFDCLDL